MATRSPLETTHFFEHIGETADLAVQHVIGEDPDFFFRFALPDKGGLVAPAVIQMAVEAVLRSIQPSAFKPFVFIFFWI